jgi:hypothetical protein
MRSNRTCLRSLRLENPTTSYPQVEDRHCFDPRASPDTLATLALRFQIAQKLHACTDPHDPPASINDRPRDVVDLLLLRDLVRTEGRPTLLDLWVAAEPIFAARAVDARALGRTERTWPCVVVAHEHGGPTSGPHWPARSWTSRSRRPSSRSTRGRPDRGSHVDPAGSAVVGPLSPSSN